MISVETLGVLVIVAGVVMGLSYFLQTYKILKRKSSDDVSLATFSIFLIGVSIFFFYGWANNDMPFTISMGIGVVGLVSVILATLKYRRAR